MIKEVKVLSRNMAKDWIDNSLPHNNTDKFALISIYGDDSALVEDPEEQLYKYNCSDYLPLEFWDLTGQEQFESVMRYYPKYKPILFNESHAKKVIKFIEEIHQDINDYVLIVHCAAGVSRSAAIGEYAVNYCGLDYEEFRKNHPNIMPNHLVLAILNRSLY